MKSSFSADAFGSPMSNRSSNASSSRYGFNGKERDDETGTQDYGMRIYNPALGKFLSVDPLTNKYPELTPYQFAGNTPIQAIDLDGLEPALAYRGMQNLVVVIQGHYDDPPDNRTQAQNNKEGYDMTGLGGLIGVGTNQTQVVVYSSSNTDNTKDDVAKTIHGFKQLNPDGKVIIVGHSLGAENAIELAKDNREINIDLLITVDGSDVLFDDSEETVPSNVKNLINYFQSEDKRGIAGEQYSEEKGNTTTRGINKYVKDAGGHTEIDNKMTETIKKDIDNFTTGKDAVQKANDRKSFPQNDTKNETFNQQ